MPYKAVGFDPSRHPPHIEISLDSATGRVIEATLRALHSQAPSTRRTEATRLAAGFCALLRSLLGFGPADEVTKHAVDDARGRAVSRRCATC